MMKFTLGIHEADQFYHNNVNDTASANCYLTIETLSTWAPGTSDLQFFNNIMK